MPVETHAPKIVNRAATSAAAAASRSVQCQPVRNRTAPHVQASLKVSSPKDPAEKEADATASKIMRMAVPEGSVAYVRTESGGVFRQVKGQEKEKKLQRFESPYIARFAGCIPMRKAEGQPNVASNVAAEIQSSTAGGSPLPLSVRRFMEPRFRADFSKVRIHTDAKAAKLNRQVNARAFAVGNSIFFGESNFNPDTREGRELIAHELTHTVQQGAAVQRSEEADVTQRSPVQVQRLGLSDALDYFADRANLIPGFRMFTIVLGLNPINMSRVDRNAANILRALIEFIPAGGLITRALDNYGIFDKIGTWVEQQIRTLGDIAGSVRQSIRSFLDSLNWTDIFDLGGVWNRAKPIFTDPIGRIISFAGGLATGILGFIRDAILRPLAGLAAQTRGWDLVKAILGRDPITGDPCPRTAETLIGGFMKLIGQEEVWENIRRANAIPRAFAWFQRALAGLRGFVQQIPALFMRALQSLEIADIVLLPRAFAKVAAAFGNFVGRFISWAGAQVMGLLEIIFAVVAPGAMIYLRRAAAAFRTIIRDPIGFVRNLVRAGIMGFQQFAANFLSHLRTSLIGWLTGTLAGANIYIPQAFNLREIIKFVLSVLGLTWQHIRRKLVRVMGERTVAVLETTFDIVVTLVREGPAAAWEKIQEHITNLREMVMEQIMNFVATRIVQAAITRLVTSLNPAGAFIQAIIAIYNTILFFVERLRQIAQVAMSFINSISAIASGVLAAAANRVEQTMAGLLTLVISFLARLVGLGRVGDAVTNIINRIRAPIDRALDRVVDWIASRARNLASRALGGDPAATPQQRLENGLREGVTAVNRLSGNRVGILLINPVLALARRRHSMQSLEAVPVNGVWHLRGQVNPSGQLPTVKQVDGAGLPGTTFRSRVTYAGLNAQGFGIRMTAERLGPDMASPGRNHVADGRYADLRALIGVRQSRYRIGHLLNNHIGGSGSDWHNLTPLSPSGNGLHFNRAEREVKPIILGGGWVYYQVIPRYTTHPALPNGAHVAERHFATSLDIEWQPLAINGDQLQPTGSLTTVSVPNALPS